jgi:hypothetical protein
MPNDALIGELDRLRETYSQRQKATNHLLATLKGATAALSKTNRTLREYADLNPTANDIAKAQQSFSASGLKEEAIDPLLPSLRREAKTLTSLAGALKDAATALRGESVDVIKLGHAYAALQGAKIQDATLAALLPDIGQEIEQAQYALGDTFGHALRAALAEQGIAIGGRSEKVATDNLREVIDRCREDLPGAMFVYAVPPAFIHDIVPKYPALQQRIQSPSYFSRSNPFSPQISRVITPETAASAIMGQSYSLMVLPSSRPGRY